MASLRKRGKVWYCRYRDAAGTQREAKCGPDKGVANQIRRELEGKLARIKLGLLDPREADCLEADRVPIAKHVSDYLATLTAKGCVPGHTDEVRRRLYWFLEETQITRLSQLRPSTALAAVAAYSKGRSERSANHFATSLKAFSRWLQKDRRTRDDLLTDLERPRVTTERARQALTLEQAARLISVTRTSKVRRGMTGEDRAWLYTLAVYSGFRRSELQSLTPESFRLDAIPPVVFLPGCDTKNSNDATQPLPSHVVPDLCVWLARKPPGVPLFLTNPETPPR